MPPLKPILLLLLYNSVCLACAKDGDRNIKHNEVHLSRRTEQRNRSLQSLCSCSPTIFNIQINFHADPCKTDRLDDNSGIKGTLCLVGHETDSEGNAGTDNNTDGSTDDGTVVLQSPSPSSNGGMPTFSPTFEPTSVASTAGSAANTQDPFMPPTGAMPIPPPTDEMPTYAPSTPFPTYETYSPTYSTYAPTALRKKKDSLLIEPVSASIPSAQTTYYPTVDGTYAPTSKSRHDVASLIKRVKVINAPTVSNTHPPSTPFPTFDTYPPTSTSIVDSEEEPKRRLLEVINLDDLEEYSKSDSLESWKTSSIVDAWRSIPTNDEFFTRFPEWKRHQEEIYRLKHDAEVKASRNENQSRLLQASIAVPSQLISAQFLEIDTSPDMTIINQDDSYLNLTDFYDADVTLSYTSISATLDPSTSLEDQLGSVPGGAILVLIGQDKNGELVRNRLMWTYTMKCDLGVETVENGDEFGWASFVSIY